MKFPNRFRVANTTNNNNKSVCDPSELSKKAQKNCTIIELYYDRLVGLVTGLFCKFFYTKKGRDANCVNGQPGVCEEKNKREYDVSRSTPIGVITPYSQEFYSIYNRLSKEFDKKFEILLKKQIIAKSDYNARRHYYSLDGLFSLSQVIALSNKSLE